MTTTDKLLKDKIKRLEANKKARQNTLNNANDILKTKLNNNKWDSKDTRIESKAKALANDKRLYNNKWELVPVWTKKNLDTSTNILNNSSAKTEIKKIELWKPKRDLNLDTFSSTTQKIIEKRNKDNENIHKDKLKKVEAERKVDQRNEQLKRKFPIKKYWIKK